MGSLLKRPRALAGACSFLLLVLCPFFVGGMPGSTSAADSDGSKVASSLECCRDEAFDLRVEALEAGETTAGTIQRVSPDFETLGKAFFYLNRWEEAVGTFQKAAELNPHAPALHFLLASALSRLRRYEEAIVEYQMLAKIEPDDGYILFSLASAYKELGQEEKAIEEFERAAPLLPRSVFVDLVIKTTFVEIRDRQKATEAARRITELRKLSAAPAPPVLKPGMLDVYCLSAKAYEYEIKALGNPEAYFRLGVMYGFIQQYRKAADAFRRAAELRRDYLDAYLLLGYTYGNDGLKQYRESIEAYRRGLAVKPDSVECLYGIGVGYRRLGKRGEAIEALDRATELVQLNGPALASIGHEYKMLKEYKKAVEVIKRAVTLEPGNYAVWSALGETQSTMKQYHQAVETFQKAISLRPDYYWAHVGVGWAYFNLGRLSEAEAAFKGAIKVRPDDTAAYLGLGHSRMSFNKFDEAVFDFEKAISLEPDHLEGYVGVAQAHGFAHRYRAAIEAYGKALKIKPECSECLTGIAISYGYLRDYENSINANMKRLELCKKKNDPVCEADVLLEMGSQNLINSQDVTADRNLKDALDVFRERNMRLSEALVLEKIAILQATIGNSKEALGYLKTALSLHKDLQQPETIVRLYTDMAIVSPSASERIQYAKLAIDLAGEAKSVNYGNVFRSYGALFNALDMTSIDDGTRETYARRFQTLVEGSHEPFDPGVSLIYGSSLSITGREDLARVHLENALRAASRTDQRDLKAAALEELIVLEAKHGNVEVAKRYCLMAVDEIDCMRKSFQSLNGRMFSSQNAQAWYAAAVISLEHSQNGEMAFNYAERARGNEFLDAVGEKVGAAVKNPDFLKRKQFLKLRAFSLEQEIRELKTAGIGENNGRLAVLEAELRKIREEYAQLLERMKKEDPESSSFFMASAVTMKEAQAIIDPDTTLLNYFIAGPQVFLWVVDKSSFKMMVLPIRGADLNAKIEAYRQKLKKIRPDYEGDAQELFDLLIRPAKPYIKTRTIGIVPHGRLHYLPFQALLDVEKRDGKTEKRFLIEEYDIFYAPSASALRYTYEKRKPVKGRVLAFGNPDLGNKDMDLPYAERELAEIGRTFPGAELYLRKDATKSRASRLSSDFDVIHFASHAEMNAKNPLSSSIRMAGSGGNDDGKLTVGEVFGLDLRNASLVTLSACETGLGELRGGDEMIGLTRAFIYAGTPSIVASLWSVNDESTSRLMALFYSNLRHLSKAEALRRAQIGMISRETGEGIVRGVGGITARPKTPGTPRETTQAGDRSHPFFWAPFILLGDWK